MIQSFHSLLYAAQLSGLFSDEDLQIIDRLKDQNADHIFNELRPEVRDALTALRWKKSWEDVVRSQEQHGIWTVSRFCKDYPPALNLLSRPPLLFSVLGNPIWLKRRMLTVVGTRHPGRSSTRWMSFHLSSFLKRTGFSVVSGGARGVDQWAHQVSLGAGHGTLAVVPSGLLNLYPNSLGDMASQIVSEGGALVSMYPIRQSMRKFFFHQRNHLLAALGEATLVVEAGIKSGTLLTAKQCRDLQRDIYCLPFSPWEERGAGNNILAREEGVRIVSNEHDLIRDMFKQFEMGI